MEQLKSMKECLVAQVQGQMGNLQQVDAKELGEAIDMIKDLEEAIYYCTIVEAMEKDKEKKEVEYYTTRRDMDMPKGKMYYTEPWNYPEPYLYTERPMNFSIRDPKEGRSPMQRRMYMEAQGQGEKLQELEKYMQELTGDIMDMIKDATPEERRMLQQKISTLATKI